ncbi:MAG: hypothetical protein EOO52_06035 [Gammaproteobacteria bacterium]|nr:MAG: hypothetical protein EOO52_06035 [Gammaproteobacteria bacterium]
MKKRVIGPAIGCFASTFIIAPPLMADGYFGSISASAFHSDNGNKSVDNKISEVQEQYDLTLGASYENYIGKFEADYSASHRRFSEETQPNKSTLEGHSALQLGHPSGFAELLIEHSRQTLLNKPDSLDLTSNQEEREVLAATPKLNWHFTSADTAFLQGNFSDIRYLENEFNNSTRSSGTLGVLHNITQVDSLGLNVSSTNVDFEFFPEANYTLRSAFLTYAVHLRQITYSLKAGASESETDAGEKFKDPTYLASITYKTGANTIDLNVAQELTDTSFGGGNKNPMMGNHTSDGGIDLSSQISRKRVDVRWATTSFCKRCTVTASLFKTQDEYLSIDKDASETGVNLVADYLLSTASNLSLSFTQSDHHLPGELLGENYKRTISAIAYTHRIGKSFSIRASYSDEKRTDDNSLFGYREKLAGINLGYSF